MTFKILLFVAISFISAETRAHLLPQANFVYARTNGDVEDYRLGNEWGKKRVTSDMLRRSSPAFVRAAAAASKLPVGGTGFYLGKFNGAHVMATNHHVCPRASACVGSKAEFRVLGKKYKMKKFYVTLPVIDLTLLEIEIPAADEALMASVAKNFDYRSHPVRGSELMTMGFGIGGNSNDHLMANADSDCRVFSKTGEYRLMADPDELNPADYSAWSFSHGCDVSHGDSGSAIVDRATGNVVGIIWTGKIPKAADVQNSQALMQLLANPTEAIWTELSYAVPASKVGEQLWALANNASVEPATREVFKALLN